MFKLDSPVCQTRVYSFDNFNSAASLLNFQEQLFTSLSDIKRLSPFPLTCVDLPGASKHRVKVLTEIPYWCGNVETFGCRLGRWRHCGGASWPPLENLLVSDSRMGNDGFYHCVLL
jgi:hypothetical protein